MLCVLLRVLVVSCLHPLNGGSWNAGPALQSQYQLRSREDFEAATGAKSPAGKRYFKHTRLADIVGAYPLRDGMSDAEVRGRRPMVLPLQSASCASRDCSELKCLHGVMKHSLKAYTAEAKRWPILCF